MKFTLIALVATFGIVTSAHAQDAKSEPADKAVKVLDGSEKKMRKKKVEICSECGKPETECECHGHKGHSDEKGEKKAAP